mgnify:CR=1 FL=1
MEFPQYRKYTNERSYFRIESETQFTEVMKIGQRIDVYTFQAKIFPDIQMVQDMLTQQSEYYALSTEEEFEAMFNKAEVK